jgi:hypothetical protein
MATVSAGGALLGLQGSRASADVDHGLEYQTYVGMDFKALSSSDTDSHYWDNGSVYTVSAVPNYSALATRINAPTGARLERAIFNIRLAAGPPMRLILLAFDALNSYQILGDVTVFDASPDLIRGIDMPITPTEIDEHWSYSLRCFFGKAELGAFPSFPPGPPYPDQLLWGARVGFRGRG